MRTPALPSPRRIAAGAGLAVLAAGLTPIAASLRTRPAQALVISEVYGGRRQRIGAIYNAGLRRAQSNPTGLTDRPRAASRSSTARASAVANGAAVIANLTGSVPANGTALVEVSGDRSPAARRSRLRTVTAPAISMAGTTDRSCCASSTRSTVDRDVRRRVRQRRGHRSTWWATARLRRPSRRRHAGTATTTLALDTAAQRAPTSDNNSQRTSRVGRTDRRELRTTCERNGPRSSATSPTRAATVGQADRAVHRDRHRRHRAATRGPLPASLPDCRIDAARPAR